MENDGDVDREYMIVWHRALENSDIAEMEKSINSLMEDGWRVSGSLSMAFRGDDVLYMAQAMTRGG